MLGFINPIITVKFSDLMHLVGPESIFRFHITAKSNRWVLVEVGKSI